ncbi:hypothetical protein HYDPIDRAFT_105338 [Hydnomerulius pinastri MD-312]|nr:hypothetical protein HYDPIDRAFT_105338 [Hydnomerulius pinastri MD-312]
MPSLDIAAEAIRRIPQDIAPAHRQCRVAKFNWQSPRASEQECTKGHPRVNGKCIVWQDAYLAPEVRLLKEQYNRKRRDIHQSRDGGRTDEEEWWLPVLRRPEYGYCDTPEAGVLPSVQLETNSGILDKQEGKRQEILEWRLRVAMENCSLEGKGGGTRSERLPDQEERFQQQAPSRHVSNRRAALRVTAEPSVGEGHEDGRKKGKILRVPKQASPRKSRKADQLLSTSTRQVTKTKEDRLSPLLHFNDMKLT